MERKQWTRRRVKSLVASMRKREREFDQERCGGRSLAFSQAYGRTLHLIDLYRAVPIPSEHSRSSFLHPTIPYHSAACCLLLLLYFALHILLLLLLHLSTSSLYLSVIFLFLCFFTKEKTTNVHTTECFRVFSVKKAASSW